MIWIVLLAPLIGVLVNGLILSWAPRATQKRLSGLVASAAAGVAFLAALVIAAQFGSLLGGAAYRDFVASSWIKVQGGSLDIPLGLRLDALSLTMMLVVTGVGTLIHIFSIGYMADDGRVGRYFTYLNLFMFAMLFLVLANNYALMFVGWEGVGLCSYLLIGFWFERVSASQAGKKAFLINRVGDFGFLLGMFALFQSTGSLTFNTADGTGVLDQASRIHTAVLLGWPAVEVICLLLFLGCSGKSAQLPLYLWLPDAMEGPTPVSALIHAATMVTAGVYLIARSAPLFALAGFASSVVAWVGIITAAWAALVALKQYDIKRVLAYSTVSQLGYMFVGVGVGAYAAGISHLMTHAFFKALMFLGAGAVMHALEGQLDMRKMGNLRRHLPITFFTFAAGMWGISGPFGSGFFSKDAILEGAFEHGYPVIGILGLLVAGLTAFYMCRMFFTVFFGSERIELGDEGHGGHEDAAHGHAPHGHASHHGHDAHHTDAHHGGHHVHVHPEQAVMNGPLVVLAVLSLAGGLLVSGMPKFLAPVTTEMVAKAKAPAVAHSQRAPAGAAHGAAAATGGAETAAGHAAEPEAEKHHSGLSAPVLMGLSILVAALGIGAAWVNQAKLAAGWSPGAERALGIHAELYEGSLHAIFVRGGTAFSQVLYNILDRLVIDNSVNGVGKGVEYLAESLRTLQTGYVRNYALVMLAGVVFVLACFFVILKYQDNRVLLGVLGGVILLFLLFSGISALLSRRRSTT